MIGSKSVLSLSYKMNYFIKTGNEEDRKKLEKRSGRLKAFGKKAASEA